MKRTLITLFVAGLIASGAAAAHDRWDNAYGPGWYERQQERNVAIREREWRIREWIQRSVADGRIRPWEARELYRELGYVRNKAQAFASDGRIDWRESAELNADLDRLAAHVRTESWTARDRGYGYYQRGYRY